MCSRPKSPKKRAVVIIVTARDPRSRYHATVRIKTVHAVRRVAAVARRASSPHAPPTTQNKIHFVDLISRVYSILQLSVAVPLSLTGVRQDFIVSLSIMSGNAKAGASPPAGAGDNEDKEKKRRKQLKRMGKILSAAWEESDAVFQDAERPSGCSEDAVYCLTDIGAKLDNQAYRVGKHGWEDFCKDLGGVYNRHIKRYV